MENSTALEDIRRIKIIRVMANMAMHSMTKAKACEIVGISVSTFDRYQLEAESVTAEFLAEVKAPIQDMFEDLVKSRTTLIKRLIDKATDPDTPIKDVLAIEARLHELQRGMESELALIGEEPKQTPPTQGMTDAEEYIKSIQLRAPSLKHGKGVATVEKTTITFEVGDNDPPVDAIEGVEGS